MNFDKKVFQDYEGGKLSLTGLTSELLCFYFTKIIQIRKQDLLIITSNLYEANKLYQSLIKLNKDVFLFPTDDFLTGEALAISPDLKIKRLETMISISEIKSPKIVITHLVGFLRYLPTKAIFKSNILTIKEGLTIKKGKVVTRLFELGYTKETLVTQTGELGERGYIVDVFPVGSEQPIRIEFFGDSIVEIRYFNSSTQCSTERVKTFQIYPFTEFLLSAYKEEVIKKQKYLRNYTKATANIGHYLKKPIVIFLDYPKIINANLQLENEIKEYKLSKQDELPTDYMYKLSSLAFEDEIYVNLDNKSNIKVDNVQSYNSKPVILPFELSIIKQQLVKMLKQGKTIIIYAPTTIMLKNLIKFLKTNYILTSETKIIKNKINLIKRDVIVNFEINNYVVLSYYSLFKKDYKGSVYKTKYNYGTKINAFNKLKVGDYVVHNKHGVGIYEGLSSLIKKDIKKDYLLVKYRDNDKLYIPVEKIDLIYKYVSAAGTNPRLDKLGGREWGIRKARLKGQIADLAKELIATSALRKATKGFSSIIEDETQIAFEKEFPFLETPDQIKAIKEIKSAMEIAEPMDQLLCGDVGFGKTEVAFRVAFKAINNNKQVAYLCPTTILAHQHYLNAVERFTSFPINIELLSRFTTKAESTKIIKNLKKGTVDFIIGTHRLLSDDVSFKDLGLLIIDEEQRFGVKHKEKIKTYKVGVDVLTLSATPIPRTLQLSLAGIKGLSLIQTPPANRFPIQTYVLEYNETLIKEVIYKELAREGQIFFLYNKVKDILKEVHKLEQLIPEARITFIHGQMEKQKIELEMFKFINQQYDLLVCTTIIETGIDIPNVNTLIVNNAEYFGLSQLYQLRGRVGRSNKIAYAYFMYEKNKVLTENAHKRLSTIKNFTELGSGFDIALQDLAIRGAGNILGSEQAGFIDAVGIELYLKMLNDEIKKIKDPGALLKENPEHEKTALNLTAHISDKYVADLDLKIELHQKINEINNYDKLKAVKQEIEDRFGPISEEILIYMYQEWFEKLILTKGIAKVRQLKEKVELIWSLEASKKIEIKQIAAIALEVAPQFKFYYKNNKFIVSLPFVDLPKHWLYILTDFLKNLSDF